MSDPLLGMFLEACGAAEAFVLGVEDVAAANLSWRMFDQPYVVVGRDPNADLYLNDPRVSRRHVYLQLVAGRLFVVDLHSRTGTHWGGEPGSWGWVDRDPGITVGPFRIRPRGDRSRAGAAASPTPMPVSRSFDQAELPEVALELAGTSAGSTTWQVDRSLVLIGSSRACKIRLQGGNISSIHASLLRTPAGLFVVDLLGKAGVIVNGRKVRSSRLEADDSIILGPHRIRVRSANPPASTGLVPLAVPGRSVVGADPPGGRDAIAAWRRHPDAGAAEDAPALLRIMLEEFGEAQTQPSDRFQQSIVAILQSFATIHREQMTMIREELDEIRRLSAEQGSLRLAIGRRDGQAAALPALRLVTGEIGGAVGPDSAPSVPRTAPDRANGRRPDLVLPDTGKSRRSGFERPTSPVPQTSRPDDLHGQIIDRITQIQDERAGRWQKILKSLLD